MPYRLLCRVLLLSVLVPSSVLARPPGGDTACPSPEARAFDYLVGRWQSDGLPGFEAEPILGGCAIQERWQGAPGSPLATGALLVRVFDEQSRRWYLSFVAPGIVLQVWEGRLEDGSWRFYRTWRQDDGQAVLSRTYWTPLPDGHVERLVEQSRDGGQSWRVHVHAVFHRPAGPDAEGPVWAADFMRTKPGQRDRYLRYVAANWARARRTAAAQGAIRSYRVLVAPPEAGPWDVVLLTEYASRNAYDRREETFGPILRAQTETLVDGLSGKGPDNPLKTTVQSLVLTAPPDNP